MYDNTSGNNITKWCIKLQDNYKYSKHSSNNIVKDCKKGLLKNDVTLFQLQNYQCSQNKY